MARPADGCHPGLASLPAGLLAEAMDFPKKCGELVNKWAQQCGVKAGRALDVGCAVGGSSFEMAKVFGEVVGFDISNTFIDKANEMKSSRQIGYKLKVEGDIVEELTATIGSDVPAERTRFVQVRHMLLTHCRASTRSPPVCSPAVIAGVSDKATLIGASTGICLPRFASFCCCQQPVYTRFLPLRVTPARSPPAWAPLTRCWPPTCCAACPTPRPSSTRRTRT